MPSIANQDYIVIEGTVYGTSQANEILIQDEDKALLRRRYIRGNIGSVIIKATSGGDAFEIIAEPSAFTKQKTSEGMVISGWVNYSATYIIKCGVLQPSDYTDDIPNV